MSIRISLDGRGRGFDNIFMERLWRTVKYEEVYIKSCENMNECRASLGTYFEFYNLKDLGFAISIITASLLSFFIGGPPCFRF